MQYRNKRELLNSSKKPVEIIDENCPLYSLEEILLLNRVDPSGHISISKVAKLGKYIGLLKNKNGYYNNIVDVKTGHDAYTSHDQLRTICVFSVLYGLNYHEEVWKKIKKGLFTYDNVIAKFNIRRLVHPRDIIFIGYLNNNILCNLCISAYFLIAYVTFSKNFKYRPTIWDRVKTRFSQGAWPKVNRVQKTDGELLYWVESHVYKSIFSKFFNKRFNKKIEKRFGSWRQVFSKYFPDQKHPINLTTARMSGKDLEIK